MLRRLWSNPVSRNIGRRTVRTVQIACLAHLFFDNVASVHPSEGASMLPTFNETGDWILEEKIIHSLFPSRVLRGELWSLVSPVDPERLVCKRVIGLPGDTICVDPTSLTDSDHYVLIPPGHVWVQGDNASNSRDSRMYGPIPMALLRGRIVAKVLPFSQRKWFSNGMVYID